MSQALSSRHDGRCPRRRSPCFAARLSAGRCLLRFQVRKADRLQSARCGRGRIARLALSSLFLQLLAFAALPLVEQVAALGTARKPSLMRDLMTWMKVSSHWMKRSMQTAVVLHLQLQHAAERSVQALAANGRQDLPGVMLQYTVGKSVAALAANGRKDLPGVRRRALE